MYKTRKGYGKDYNIRSGSEIVHVFNSNVKLCLNFENSYMTFKTHEKARILSKYH